MKNQVFRLQEKNGFILYEREKTKIKGYAKWPKYFINNVIEQNYFQEFNTLKQAQTEFSRLTN